jgi:hypothetical protein
LAHLVGQDKDRGMERGLFGPEWLAGLLLRCDEVNHWESRTTLTHLLAPGPEKFHRCWRTAKVCTLCLDHVCACTTAPLFLIFLFELISLHNSWDTRSAGGSLGGDLDSGSSASRMEQHNE